MKKRILAIGVILMFFLAGCGGEAPVKPDMASENAIPKSAAPESYDTGDTGQDSQIESDE